MHLRQNICLFARIQRVVDGLLSLGRGPLDIATIRIAEVLDDVTLQLSPLAKDSRVHVEQQVEPDLPSLQADRSLLVAALLAVAENAVAAMPEGGKLRLSVMRPSRTQVVRFELSDSGPGVPAGVLPQIFEPFFTTRSGGTGLGLAIARGIVSGHGGRIWGESPSEGGARFVIELPLHSTQ